MSISKPSELPLELIEQIIDETFHAQYSTRADKRSEKMIIDPQTLSSIASVSHVFRQRVNSHRFSTVSFRRGDFRPPPLPYVHAFRDLLQSDVWEAPSMGLARHVRRLVLILSERDEQLDFHPHRAIEDGTFTTIMNAIFRGGASYPIALSHGDYALELWGYTGGHILSWDAMSPDFTSTVERVSDSCVTTLDLKWLSDVPPTLAKRRNVKHLSIYLTFFHLTTQHITDFLLLGPWNHLESLHIDAPHLFDSGDPEVMPMLKALTITFQDGDSAMAESLIFQQPATHWKTLRSILITVRRSFPESMPEIRRSINHHHRADHLEPRFRVDYRNFANLTRLTINLLMYYYHSSMNTPAINENTPQILNLLGPHLPRLACLEICIDSHLHALGYAHRPANLLAQIDCASLDAALVQYAPSAVATIVLRFGLKMFMGPGDYMERETFRKDGLVVLREAFPRLNAGPRRRVYDSELAATWEDEERRLLYGGMFSVAYIAAASENTV